MIYLASTSPRRKKILRDMGIRFRILKSDYHEKKLPGAGPRKLVRLHALGKALSASRLVRNGILITADTIVYFRGKIIGKPRRLKDAFSILGRLQGQWHTVYTGVAFFEIKNSSVKKRRILVEKTDVLLKPMSREEIARYFKKINPLDKAGAYAIQSRRAGIVKEVRGLFSNAVGLPIERIKTLII